uniref:Phospholipase A2 n=1 Tax=Salarias fasciatus TaxID=181472 RepID=A0A672JEG0_SALFA
SHALQTLTMNLTAPLLVGALLPKAVWHFGSMITCVQPGVNPLKYNEYGCYCGLGGQGTPKDDLDRCCQVHDNCYGSVGKISGCSGFTDIPHIIQYDFTCSNKRVTCAASNDPCQAASCECDRVAAYCFNGKPYNDDYKYLDSSVHCAK